VIYLVHLVDFLVVFVLMIRMIGDGDGRAPADDASGENKEPSEEKSTVVENTSTPVTDIPVVTTHRVEKKEPQTTIKTLMPVIRSPSHAQEISATERLAYSSVSYIFFQPIKENISILFRRDSLSQLFNYGNFVLYFLGCTILKGVSRRSCPD
jgi:hypothetical protein